MLYTINTTLTRIFVSINFIAVGNTWHAYAHTHYRYDFCRFKCLITVNSG